MQDRSCAVVGEASESIDECLASGALRTDDGGIAFRHELARVAVEESISPARRLALHRSGAACAHRLAARHVRCRTGRASRRAGGRPRGSAPVRARGGRRSSTSRGLPRGGSAVCAGTALRRRPLPGGSRRPPRRPFPSVLPRRRPDRGNSGDPGGDPVQAGPGRTARGGARPHRAHRLSLVPRVQR